ncbi:outer dense fiber protein 3-B [Anguilla anguilla]|nr:outer dense fiber protein 3-B [Anguilla anguilla]XP_035280348.1 outer dense fiber protein 3-B [Anguilla anguilla]XP_035280349.1 outer dense fiber protein 3-B [Anguilla anguilla]
MSDGETDAWVGVWRPHKPRGPIAALYSSPGPKYALPGSTGNDFHDPRKLKAPAFSFGIRRSQLSSDLSPGPGYLVPANITRIGRSGTPAYSLYSRPKDSLRFQTPGPGKYAPERAGKSAFYSSPAYSMSARTGGFFNPTSPGPAAYTLPSVLGTSTVNKPSAPNFSLTGRSKVGSFHEDLQKTPGPGTYKMVEPSSYKYKPPQYSMIGRNMMPGDLTEKPGPGAYRPEVVTFTRRKSPCFSFGIRHSEFSTPVFLDKED